MEAKKMIALLREIGIKVEDLETYTVLGVAANVREHYGPMLIEDKQVLGTLKVVDINIAMEKREPKTETPKV